MRSLLFLVPGALVVVAVACGEDGDPASPEVPPVTGTNTPDATVPIADAGPRADADAAVTRTSPAGGRDAAVPCSDAGDAGTVCFADSDCSDAGVCACASGKEGQNLCFGNSNCRLDSDCASGERCVESLPVPLVMQGIVAGNEIAGPNYDGFAVGYFCTTPKDDCACPDAGGQQTWCAYNVKDTRWECSSGP